MTPQLTTPTTATPLALSDAITHIVTQTSTVANTTITLAAAAATPSSYTPSQEFQRSILNSTNYFRYLHPAAYLSYNATLATFAQSYSEKCTWSHNPDIGELGYGENLAKGYSNPGSAVDAWGNEADLFNFDESDYTGFTEATGHFTQLVWRGTASVGCGWTDCTSSSSDVDGILLVCNYYPAGNIMAPSSNGGDEYMFFKQNVVAERAEGDTGFNAEEAGRGVGGPNGTATESVVGTMTANAAANVVTAGIGWREWMGSTAVVCVGLMVGVFML